MGKHSGSASHPHPQLKALWCPQLCTQLRLRWTGDPGFPVRSGSCLARKKGPECQGVIRSCQPSQVFEQHGEHFGHTPQSRPHKALQTAPTARLNGGSWRGTSTSNNLHGAVFLPESCSMNPPIFRGFKRSGRNAEKRQKQGKETGGKAGSQVSHGEEEA